VVEGAEPRKAGSGAGLSWVLGATVIAGAIGYVIQAAVPAFLSADEYVVFSVFWSIAYLVVSGLGGLQQEVTRASRHLAKGDGWPVLARFAALCSALVAVTISSTAVLWAPRVFSTGTIPLVAALVVAAVGYTFIAVISGALYGVKNWRGVAGMTVTDAGVRLMTVTVALAVGSQVVGLGWAVAVPFAVAAAIVLLVTGRGLRRHVSLDTGFAGLMRNSGQTVPAAIATGVLISGLPFLLGITSSQNDPSLLASLILVITLTRAPLVIPLLALQSYLVVTFRDDTAHLLKRVSIWGGALLGVTVALSALAIFVGPWFIALLYGDRYGLAEAAYAAIVASAGLTGLLCITGPALLARGHHAMYLMGWAAASLVTIFCLILPLGETGRVLAALLVGPAIGVIIHLATLRRGRRSATE
jgi:O-antigen/teichoic acid export membrane protein